MHTQRLTSAARYLGHLLADARRQLLALRERLRTVEDIQDARGIALLREWLSPQQKAQFDASKCFEVVGCDSGKRYRISYCKGTNVHELDKAGRPVLGWCFVPSGNLVAGDVMLAQKIALETNENGALTVANRFPAHAPRRPNVFLRRAY